MGRVNVDYIVTKTRSSIFIISNYKNLKISSVVSKTFSFDISKKNRCLFKFRLGEAMTRKAHRVGATQLSLTTTKGIQTLFQILTIKGLLKVIHLSNPVIMTIRKLGGLSSPCLTPHELLRKPLELGLYLVYKYEKKTNSEF